MSDKEKYCEFCGKEKRAVLSEWGCQCFKHRQPCCTRCGRLLPDWSDPNASRDDLRTCSCWKDDLKIQFPKLFP